MLAYLAFVMVLKKLRLWLTNVINCAATNEKFDLVMAADDIQAKCIMNHIDMNVGPPIYDGLLLIYLIKDRVMSHPIGQYYHS